MGCKKLVNSEFGNSCFDHKHEVGGRLCDLRVARVVDATAALSNGVCETLVVIDWDFLEAGLKSLRRAGLYRHPDDGSARDSWTHAAEASGITPIDASSNDYLGYAKDPVSRETQSSEASTGAGASRLIHGTRPAHRTLERALSVWVEQPAALLFA